MPGKVKVKVISGRNLPVMDRSSDTTDAYVEIKLANTTHKTDVCRKSLHPQWNSEWYRFEVDDTELQDEPLQIRLMDHDTYSANDAIGKVYLDLNPLLLPAAGLLRKYGDANTNENAQNSVMSGWIPVYDTMHGIRGEVNIIVKVELFSDFNRFRQSSCGVQFFCSPTIPHGHYAQNIHGFVEELLVNDDPEYQWIDKIRTPRASNEARQTLFFKLSGELQRKIGVKALDLGANCVIGYRQCFDLEGESGIVARGIGTAVTLIKIVDISHVPEAVNEEHVESYLKFIGSASSFRLNAEPNQNFISSFLQKPTKQGPLLPHVAQFDSDLSSRQMSYKPAHIHSSQSNPMLSDSKTHTSLHILLEQEDKRSTPGHGISQRIKNLKYSSQNILSKKITALKSKLKDGIEENEEDADSTSISSVNLKKKRLFPFKKTVSDTSVLAELLARSVIQAHNSLSCIIEAHDATTSDEEVKDSEEASLNELEPAIGILEKTVSEPQLSTHEYEGAHTFNISYSSSESFSSEEEDEECTSKEDLNFDTISNIVKTVKILQQTESVKKAKLEKQLSLPTLPLHFPKYSEPSHVKNPFEFPVSPTSSVSVIINDDFSSIDNPKDETASMKSELFSNNYLETDVEKEPLLMKGKYPNDTSFVVEKDNSLSEVKLNDVIHNFSCERVSEMMKGDNSCPEQNTDFILQDCPMAIPRKSLESKLILPPVMIDGNMEHQSLVKTAMQTILLEKANIMGTYTPPMSPCSPISSSTSTPIVQRRQQFMTTIEIKPIIPRSSTAISLSEYYKQKDSVLGAPFVSMSDLKSELLRRHSYRDPKKEILSGIPFQTLSSKVLRLNQKGFGGFSDSELNRPVTDLEQILQQKSKTQGFFNTVWKHRPSFRNLLGESTSRKGSLKIDKLQENSGRRKFSFLRRKSHETGSNLKKQKSISSDAIHKKKFHFLPRQRKCSESDAKEDKSAKELGRRLSHIFHSIKKSEDERAKEKKHGLLESALGNVVRETVQEILFTGHDDGKVTENAKTPTNLINNDKKTNKEVKSATAHDSIKGNKNLKTSSGSNENAINKDVTIPICNDEQVKTIENHTHNDEKGDHILKPPVDLVYDNKNDMEDVEIPKPPIFLSPTVLTVNNKNETPSTSFSETILPITKEVAIGNSSNNPHASLTLSDRCNSSPIPDTHHTDHHRSDSVGTKISHSPAKINSIAYTHRRSSDSDLSITPKGNSLTGSDRSGGGAPGHFMKSNIILRSAVQQDNFEMLEYPFLTMSKYPAGFIVHLGGSVSARSVKLLERITNLEEPETRDTWWSELRMEIRSHARALNCNAVLGYIETTSICEDVCVLSASGTAAVIGYPYVGDVGEGLSSLSMLPKQQSVVKDVMTSSLDRNEFDREKNMPKLSETNTKGPLDSPECDNNVNYLNPSACMICHLPFNVNVSHRTATLKCTTCRSGKVPDVLIATIEAPDGIPTIGRGCFVQSFVCRQLRDLRGESNAKEISDGLPFLEYELHRLLVNKLKIKGMNAIFGLKIRISIGEKMLIGIASGTANFLAPLHSPMMPKLVSDRTADGKKMSDLQKHLIETVKQNREIYQLKNTDESVNGRVLSDDDSEDELTNLELSVGNKDCCVLEVDDPDDAEVVNLLMEQRPPDGIHVVNTEFVPGLEELEIVKNLQMFKQIYRAKIQYPFNLNHHFQRLLQSVYFKLRRMVPCALCHLQFRVDLPEPDELQLTVLGMALGLGDSQRLRYKRKNVVPKHDDLIFNLEEDNIPENSIVNTNQTPNYLNAHNSKHRQKSPLRTRVQSLKQRHMPYRERHGVDITPLSYVPGGKIERYLGNLNFFFIRETTSIREEGGLSGFIHSFVTEVLAIVRAHVTALGGNAMVAYFMTECVLNYNLHKNQGQCLINVGGDVVFISYFNDEV